MANKTYLDHLYELPEDEFNTLWAQSRQYLERFPTVNASLEEILELMYYTSKQQIDPREWDEAFKDYYK